MFQFHFQVGSIRKELREIMSALTDLQNATNALGTSVAGILTAINADTVSKADVEIAVASINTNAASLDAETKVLNGTATSTGT